MKIDYHLHLEEGPYTSSWLKRTFESVTNLVEMKFEVGSLEWMQEATALVADRVKNGSLNAEWLDLYLIQAKKLKLNEVGIVDHLYRFKEYKSYYEKYISLEDDELGNMQRSWLDRVCVESIENFIEVIEEGKAKWKEAGIELRLGIEADYFPGGEEELEKILNEFPYDYVIGSVHFINGWGFDNPKLQHLFLNYDLEDLYKMFFDIVKKGISSGLFDIFAHLDNIKVFEYRPDENKLLPLYDQVAKKLIEMNVATELNAGLFYRYPIKEMCPSPMFLEVLAKNNVGITISSDAHFPDDMGIHATLQLDKLKEHGFNNIATFKQRVRVDEEIVSIV
ncbi:histidinol phosphate phosphatase domain-containing protein [Sporosarcina sp. Marseille-Q4063]|uniref:histidinol phosphate phosphatase domain-containing protein n=1 Tax=Sporosarcina sp. Marseille-Q4063 TaxID=2810514 RepID=UPI001BAF7E58|nr:histidinol phosphate phosphatase domain-containing protein [Sporosarcina sp. Marseille-Q4063]QUW21512.1 histidinol phosphate phosphatase domain-containing protein [Sporosarcina sp. Marseille-Q4063]